MCWVRRLAPSLVTLLLVCSTSARAASDCRPGIYGDISNEYVIIGAVPGASPSTKFYLFRNGIRGPIDAPDAKVTCTDGVVSVHNANRAIVRWSREPTREIDATFSSVGTSLSGRLIIPYKQKNPRIPVVVLVHGSERTPAIGTVNPYMLAAQGIAAFVYDKRGTGASEGDYTQNFELLADDAAAALAQARDMTRQWSDRIGFYGVSQGGWVAPLAATRSSPDFVGVGFGLVVSPIEEDRSQLMDEAQRLHLSGRDIETLDKLSAATSELLLSGFSKGYDELDSVRQELNGRPWANTIKGEYSGDMLRTNNSTLKRVGKARFDNVGLIWDYNAKTTLQNVKAPILWILAANDREAPIKQTLPLITDLVRSKRRVEGYIFPKTDHGMLEYTDNADGTRTVTRVTDGYWKLVADWIKGDVAGSYGRGTVIR